MVREMAQNARAASRTLALLTTEQKNAGLLAMADALERESDRLIAENSVDIVAARAAGLSEALIDRLTLTEPRIQGIANAVREVSTLPDPVGVVLSDDIRPNGLRIRKLSVPIGVIAVIYESRPNVTADSAALCLKSGNAVILRGGKEAIRSNLAIADTIRRALQSVGLPIDAVQLVSDTSRETARALMQLHGEIDVLIPRGGAGLIRSIVENASVPVIETGAGTCHTYVDRDADLSMAARVIENAKTSRPSVCNACECILIHEAIAERALPEIARALSKKQVEIRGDEAVCRILPDSTPATQDDWGREYNDYILAARVVRDLDEAIDHITRYGTGHSECIITDNPDTARAFLARVDAAAVYVNASTRFTDGGEFGLGAEIGISTQKLHARGPLGLPALTSTKYVIWGDGQIR